MSFSLAAVDRDTAPLRPFEGTDISGMPRQELLGLLRLASTAKATVDRMVAHVAGEVARRSTPQDGPGGLARQQGFASPEQMVASVLGGAHGEGVKFVNAGVAMNQGGPVAGGLTEGELSVSQADLIKSTLARLTGDTRELEERLVRAAAVLDYRKLKLLCMREAAKFDAAQTEDRERRQYEQRSLDLIELASGMTRIEGCLDPASAAFVKTYLDAQVKAGFQAKREVDDPRTASQMRADALVALAVHGLDCESRATGVKATVIVRVDADQLRDEAGTVSCDALATPISMDAFRRIAVDASILPMVLDGKRQCLDMAREERLFSWAQRMALAERDGGCAKCHAPISHCIAHHIRHWQFGGTTDLKTGLLLCVRCHTQVHHDRWGIEVDDDNHVWFTPPREVDPDQRRILGGLAALTAR